MNASQMLSQRTDRFEVPDDLAAAESKLVYLFVTTSEGATVDELQSSLGLKKITLFPVLDTLSKRGLIERTDGTYVPTAS